MTPRRALWIVFGIGLFGAVFSGFLTYGELFGTSVASCPSPGAPGTVLGYPACVYGFFMYLAMVGVASWGLLAGRRTARRPRRGVPIGSERLHA